MFAAFCIASLQGSKLAYRSADTYCIAHVASMRFLSAQRNCLTAWLHHVHVLLVCLSCVIKTALFTLPCVCTENQGPSFRGLFGGDRIGDDAYCMFSEGVHVPGRWRLSVSFTAGPDRDSHSANAPLPRPRLPSYERQRRVEVHRGAVGTQRVRIYGWSWWHCVCVRASVVVHDFEELRPMLVPPSHRPRIRVESLPFGSMHT